MQLSYCTKSGQSGGVFVRGDLMERRNHVEKRLDLAFTQEGQRITHTRNGELIQNIWIVKLFVIYCDADATALLWDDDNELA